MTSQKEGKINELLFMKNPHKKVKSRFICDSHIVLTFKYAQCFFFCNELNDKRIRLILFGLENICCRLWLRTRISGNWAWYVLRGMTT
jgi:hypothetical protein